MESESVQKNMNGKSQGMTKPVKSMDGSGQMDNSMPMEEGMEKMSLFKKWWFWAAVGGVIVVLALVLFFLL